MTLRFKIRLAFALVVLLARLAFGQTDSALDGTVTTDSGLPVAGVLVTGSPTHPHYLATEGTRTNEKGTFHLDHSGTVVHFLHKDFEPQSVVVKTGSTNFDIKLASSADDLVMPACAKSISGQKRIGWGKSGMQFFVPRRGVRILDGKVSVDALAYRIELKASHAHLNLLFGMYWMGMDPEDERLLGSTWFSQRRILSAKGELVGVDSRGQLRDGQIWRQASMGGEGATYKVSSQQDAKAFDKIVDSLCEAPYSK